MTTARKSDALTVKRLRNKVLRKVLAGGQRIGLDITPHHFYSNVPDLRTLNAESLWRAPRSMHGVHGTDLDAQFDFLAGCMTEPVVSALQARDVYLRACAANGAVGYGPMEAQVLFGFIATHRPRQVLQIGSGVSTAVILDAAATFDLDISVTCIDPFPTDYLRALALDGTIRLLDVPAQEVDLTEFTGLGEGDLLFVDSTHTVKPGSEVNRIILDLLPRLGTGVFVHVHDIYFPYDYGRDVLTEELFFWNESVLLHAFLINNSAATIRMSCSMLHHDRADRLQALMPRYEPQAMDDGLARDGRIDGHFPSSTYVQITG